MFVPEFLDRNGNPEFMNCDELLNFMYETYFEAYVGNATFQGDEVRFSKKETYSSLCKKVIVSPKYPRAVFFVEDVVDGYFDLHLLVREGNLSNLPTVTLPMYVRDEIIETIAGRY